MSARMVGGIVYPWASQAHQHPASALPGIHHRVEHVDGAPIDCVTSYDSLGILVGILYRYPEGAEGWEEPGAINVWVRPDRQREGIGRAMLDYTEQHLGPIDWDAQRYTRAGLALRERYLQEQDERWPK